VAEVIKAQPDVSFMVEGHTDNKAISTAVIRDNWDLSVLRATAVVRVLQKSYGVDPSRMIAAGRSQYVPVAGNETSTGRSQNRRTRIVILPQLDQFFKLMEPK
jgi:chemotaxis protein MotB